MPDITKEFIRNIPLEKYLKNAENRKIVVWAVSYTHLRAHETY